MVRPRRIRKIRFQPDATYFKPAGVPMRYLEEIKVTFSEVEAMRLIDVEKMDQKKAAKKMGISQPTLSRLLKECRRKLSEAIVNGKSIKIEGGIYKMTNQTSGGGRFRAPQGGKERMHGDKAGSGPNGNCVCPNCNYKQPHVVGQPCNQLECPKCGKRMTKE